MSREHILWQKVPLQSQQTCFQNCLELFNILALTHRKRQVVSEERGSTGIHPPAKLCPKLPSRREELIEYIRVVHRDDIAEMNRSLAVDALAGPH